MKRTNRKHEQGQIIVILALALVALLGFTALAVDVGMAFSDRRNDQNVADSIALAGSQAAARRAITAYKADSSGQEGTTATFNCPADFNFATDTASGWVQQAMHDAFITAQERGTVNGYTLSAVFSEADLQSAQEGIYIKCVNSLDQDQLGIFTYAMVSSITKSSFAHFVFGDQLRNTVTAIARAEPFYSMYSGAAIVSLDPVNCSNGGNNGGGVWFDGNVNVKIKGGGAHSNTCMDKNGEGSGFVDLIGDPPPQAIYNTGSSVCATFMQNEDPYCTEHKDLQIPRVTVPPPDCSFDKDNFPDRTLGNNDTDMWPGRYQATSINGNKQFTIVMHPGLYCFYGDFTATSASEKGSTLTGTGVTIYMVDGIFSMTGKADYTLSAPGPSTSPTNPPVNRALAGFLLLYRYAKSSPDCQNANTSELRMEGNTLAQYTGTVYAPCSQIDFGGNSGIDQSTAQLIGNTIKIHGNPVDSFFYDSGLMGVLSPLVDLHK
jgi:hypothetical protein